MLLPLLLAGCGHGEPGGSFESSVPLLNQIWQESATTAAQMRAKPERLAKGCVFPEGHTIILDGVVRDRCEFIGDLAVTAKTLLVSRSDSAGDIRFALQWFCDHQRPDGSIPPATEPGYHVTLEDYQAYWIDVLHTYLLYTGDYASARKLYLCLPPVLDRWYPAQTKGGLFRTDTRRRDYAGMDRQSGTVAYYNALQPWALSEGAEIADWLGHPDDSKRWRIRANTLAPKIDATFWDPQVGAYKDTTDAPVVHPQDGNAFAVLGGVASPARARSALDYVGRANGRAYGNTEADSDLWADAKLFGILAKERVYPFMSYFEVLARFRAKLDNSAVELLSREWGYMLHNGPGTTWETIGPYGGPPVNHSWSHGWSSGAAPALTEYVLGVRPTSPGFATFTVDPHPGPAISAKGTVPTPHGPIHVEWQRNFGNGFEIKVHAPKGERYVPDR